MGLILVAGLILSFFWYALIFLENAQVSAGDLIGAIKQGVGQRQTLPEHINFLFLGIDQRQDQLESTLLADTIIFASLNRGNRKLMMIALPRDLWLDNLKTKINALYYYGTKTPGKTGLSYSLVQISEIIGQPINFGLVLNYAKFAQFIDAVGGVDVSVARPFTDNEYPNPKFTGASDSAEPVYITVSFNAGQQHLNGERVLEYVRSRHSSDPEEGSDLARSTRQLQVFQALVAKVNQPKTLANPAMIGQLYHFWRQKLETNLTDNDTFAMIFALWSDGKVKTEAQKISTDDGSSPEPILVHPPVARYGQWIWEPAGGSWERLQAFIAEAIR